MTTTQKVATLPEPSVKRTHIPAPLISATLVLSACGVNTPTNPGTVQPPVTQPPVTPPVTPLVTDPDQGKALNLLAEISLNAGSGVPLSPFSKGRTVTVSGMPSGVTAKVQVRRLTGFLEHYHFLSLLMLIWERARRMHPFPTSLHMRTVALPTLIYEWPDGGADSGSTHTSPRA